MSLSLVITFLVVLLVITFCAGINRWISAAREIDDRFIENAVETKATSKQQGTLRDSVDSVDKRIGKTSFAQKIERRLIAADSKMTVTEFLLMRSGAALLGFMLGWLISGYMLGGVFLAIMGWWLPSVHLNRKEAQRMRKFADQLPDFLILLIGSLRAGYGLLYALKVIENEMPNPIAAEFGRVVKETSLGYSMDEALDHLVERIDNEDLELIVTTIHIQNEVGGNLAEVMHNISKTISERIQLTGEIRLLTTQQRATGGILSALPFIVGTVLMLINPEYIMGMFQRSWVLIIPATALTLIVLGNLVMRRMMHIRV